MKRIFSTFITALALLIMVSSCSNDATIMRKKVTGKAGELIIVVPRPTWDSEIGSNLRQVLAQPQLGLPQDEPIFDLIDVPPIAFKEIFKTSRNIVTVNISTTIDSSRVEFKKDVWAWPQSVVNIHAKTKQEFTKLFAEYSDRIIAYMLKAERDRLLMNLKNYHDNLAKSVVLEKFGFNLNLAPGFRLVDQTDDFAWIKFETPEIGQGIIIHSYPYKSDSTFTENFLIQKRDSILKEHVDGALEGSYMTTEHQLPPVFNVFNFKKNYAAMMRGLWRVENDFMGGPYLNMTVLDASNNRVIMIDGYVYSPRFKKRNYLRQMEAMMYSLSFPNQAKNDKISSQIKMGN